MDHGTLWLKKSRKAGEMMDQNPDVQEDLDTGGKLKNWLQDNVRIILSVLIVLAIAGGIYSYSKRTEAPTTDELAMQGAEQQVSGDQAQKNGNDAVTIIGEDNKDQKESDQATADDQQNQQDQQAGKEDVKVNAETPQDQTATSQETEEAFVVQAVRGDSLTTLSRKALKDYLEKNNDSSLTAEHKIYIEDYLRRRVGASPRVTVGENVSFSKVMIKDAIEKAKILNDAQLNNLKKYSARVSTI